MQTEALWTQPHADCADPSRWHSPDAFAAESEVSVFLGALCTVLRPHRVLETGAYEGDTTEAMGTALKGYGHLDSLEIDVERAERARARVAGLPVAVHAIDSLKFPPGEYDLMFFDSDIPARPHEMRRFARSGAVWVLHDARFDEVRLGLEGLLGEVIDSYMYMRTPRGLAMGVFV
jgi:predicted O-methyltransferase YrrM